METTQTTALPVQDDLVITIESSEGNEIKVKAKFAFMSKHIRMMVEDTGPDDAVPVPNVDSKILTKVFEYCEYHHSRPPKEIEKPLRSSLLSEVVDEWDDKFIEVDQATLIDLINAANYLDIPPLLDLACAKIASLIHGKTIEEIRILLNIKSDFTPEEEARIREENKWCEEA